MKPRHTGKDNIKMDVR